MARNPRRLQLPIVAEPGRGERADPARAFRPHYVVWELTLRCDQPCVFCGSRAGDPRASELDTPRALEVARELAALGASEVVLIGGEAYLHPGFLEVVKALSEAGVRPTMTTGGRGVDEALARAAADAGLFAASVSVDGLERTHDLLRANRGSFAAATRALQALRAAGIATSSNTNVNRQNRGELEALYEHLRGLGIASWQVQLTTPLGRAADRPDLVLQPYDLLDLLPRVAHLKERAFRDGVLLMPGNNLGYFGPEEATLRSLEPEGADHFQGCQAGRYVLGIESDGAVKGCPSLQTTSYVGGSLRDSTVRALWESSPELAFARARTREDLWGFCAECDFADVCLGGCTFTAHAILGRPGNNPYCHYRARTLDARGQRERMVPSRPAPGAPFDNGQFELIVEPADAPEPPAPEGPFGLVQLRRSGRAP
ncbi:MAG: radical SAM protein [Myxococcales bacterium]|jgi:radical SAM protein with 4Fe4S-binding SPASM domain|nr:radical SAM protein [Myxococcales bacterium]HQY63095.1 radical SAM protein [Polyangiaceae bacterium]